MLSRSSLGFSILKIFYIIFSTVVPRKLVCLGAFFFCLLFVCFGEKKICNPSILISIPLKKSQQKKHSNCIMLFMGHTEETGNGHLPLIGYNSKTPPISSPTPSNLRIVICRRPVEETKEILSETQSLCTFLGRFQFNQPGLCLLN